MPAKIQDHWVDRITFLKSNNTEWGQPRLYNALWAEAAELDRTDVPSQGWIGKWLREEWPKLTDAQRRDYREVHWPETFERGDLPWEASRALLDFFVGRGRPDRIGTERPTTLLARWYWRLYQVAQPEEDEWQHNLGPTELDRVEAMARQIAAHETSEGVPEHALRAVEGWLACHGWTKEGETEYFKGAGRGWWLVL